jgi:hypothetical protein
LRSNVPFSSRVGLARGGLTLGLLLLLAGCTPRETDNIAAAIGRNGKPQAKFSVCAGDWVESFKIFEEGGNGDSWSIESDGSASGMISEIELFNAPAGWSIMTGSLAELKAGQLYGMDAGFYQHRVLYVRFTLEDLRLLDAGDVWTRNAERNKVESEQMTQEDFEKHAQSAC